MKLLQLCEFPFNVGKLIIYRTLTHILRAYYSKFYILNTVTVVLNVRYRHPSIKF